MFSKQLAYSLFAIIALLAILFGVSIFSNYEKNITTEKKINSIITKFEEKFKNDSIYLAKANKLYIDKLSQHIIDSISTIYQIKLEKEINKSKWYKKLLRQNNISLKTGHKKTNVINTTKKHNLTFKNATYNKTISNKSTKLVKSKLDKNFINPVISKSEKHLTHNNYMLDNAENFFDIENAPVYRGCESSSKKNELKTCFAINISKHIFNKFNATNLNSIGLKKGIHKVRILFVVDKKGVAKIGKIIGDWPYEVYNTAKNAVTSIPKMKPGKKFGKPIAVKYSVLIPFITD